MASVSEDISPADFVKKIRELGEQRDREDAARFAQLEQDIAKGKEERAARRAERARSISPEKTISTSSPSSRERHATPSSISPRTSRDSTTMPGQESPTQLARSGTLSWQQRPKSSSGRRPLSFVAAENAAARSPRDTPDDTAPQHTEKSREDIAASLATKDPAWFRQTADRGVDSAAYMRNQAEDPSATEFVSGQRGLPGMSRSPPPDDMRSISPARQSSVRNSAALNMNSNRFSAVSSGSDVKFPSLDPPALNPGGNDASSRLANRSPSPTKGMGGFVQSAMLKRSDSVNKRWSSQAGSALSRQDSKANNRGGAYAGSTSMPRLDARSSTSPSRGNSAEPGSRPTSSHEKSFEQSMDDSMVSDDRDGFARPALPMHSRSKSTASLRSTQSNENDLTSPPSPSKRWSPTKASWLESALNKPEEKPKATPPPAQPTWLSELNKSKQQKTSSPSVDLDADTPKTTPKVAPKAFDTPLHKAKSPPPEPAAKPPAFVKEQSDPTSLRFTKSPSPVMTPKPAPKPDFSKPAAEPGKFDFRANLKQRQSSSDANKNDEPEFRNALGKLKRTQTQKYEAPDVLKNNIMQGKAALNITGGPAPRVKKDELKESLIQRKAEMQAKAASEGPKKPIEKPDTGTPEALAKRKMMGRSGDFQDPLEKSKSLDSSRPEALARFRSLSDKAKPQLPEKPASPPLARKEPLPPKDEMSSKPSAQRTSSTEDDAANVNRFAGGLKSGTSSKLADRFNPALVGILARGPSPMGNKSGVVTQSASSDSTSAPKAQTAEEPNPGRELTHMTKGRARGPRRKAPTTKTTEPSSDTTPSTPSQGARLPSVSLVKPQHVLQSSPVQATFVAASAEEEYSAKAKPAAPTKSSRLSQVTSPKAEDVENVQPEDIKTPIKAQASGERSPLQDQTSAKRHSRGLSRSSVKDRSAAVTSPQSPPAPIGEDSKRESVASVISPKSSSTRWSKPTEATETSSVSTSRPWSTISEKGLPSPGETAEPTKRQSHDTKPSAKAPGPKPSAMWGSLGHLQRADTLDMKQEPPSKRPESPVKSRSPARQNDDLSGVSVRGAAAIWSRSAEPASSSPDRPKSPVKLPTRGDEEKALRDAGLMPPPEKPAALGLGISGGSTTQSTTRFNNFPTSPPLSAGLPTPDTSTVADTKTNGYSSKRASAAKSPSNASVNVPAEAPRPKTPEQQKSRPASLTIRPPPESPIPHTSEANRLFTDFFDQRPVITSMPEIDTLAILQHEPFPVQEVTTIRKQMQVVLGGNKLSTVPQDQSHMLYDDCMYICTHTFSTSTGSKTTEVYLWIGSQVPAAAVEDVQVFARKAAKDADAKLELLPQGKETPKFFQAIGGSLITFRGSPSRSSTTVPATFILCGRRHLGHITFDEVDFALSSFCSAFPYIVRSKDGQIYLWKGIGCHSDELGCALLIAMELGMTPDNQIREGEEPASFFELFPLPSTPSPTLMKSFSTSRLAAKPSIPRSAEHWRLKPRCDKYRCRLFRVSEPSSSSTKGGRASLQVSSFFGSVTDSIRGKQRSWSSLMPPLSSPSKEIPSPTARDSLGGDAGHSRPVTPTTPGAITPNGTGAAAGGSSGKGSEQQCLIREIAPFTQEDLAGDGIFVLDAFFEIYVLIGANAQAQSSAFTTAILFAQDYGIIAASLEDRPFVPVSTVVLEGAPRDMRACFRKWRDGGDAGANGQGGRAGNVKGRKEGVGVAIGSGNGNPKRSGSLRCVGLAAALAAARMEER